MAVVEGPLSKWTNVMKGWQYRWFVLDEASGLLSYYTSKEKMMRGARRGCVRLKGAVIGIDDEDDSTFTVTVDHKTFHFQARDAEEREKWLQGLENAILRHTHTFKKPGQKPIPSVADFEKKLAETDAYLQLLIGQVENLEKKIEACEDIAAKEKYNVIKVTAEAMIEAIKHAIVMLQISKESLKEPVMNGSIHEPLLTHSADFSHFGGSRAPQKVFTPSQNSQSLPPSESSKSLDFCQEIPLSGHSSTILNASTVNSTVSRKLSSPDRSECEVPERSYSSSEEEDFFDAEEQESSVSETTQDDSGHDQTQEKDVDETGSKNDMVAAPPVIASEDDFFDELYDERDNEDLGSLEQHGSIIAHLLSQVRIGMDLTKVVLPTFILERRSLLEMYAEFLAHPDLFIKIADMPTPADRMIQLVRWYLSAFHAGRNSEVAKKPYNPILGETFLCHWDMAECPKSKDLVEDGPVPWATKENLAFIAEQVSHHPPISAFYAEHYNKKISLDGYIWTKSKFLGLSIGVHMIGQAVVSLIEKDEEYILTFPNGYGRSILTVPWVELGGKISINCAKTGYNAAIEFHTKPFYGGKKHRVTAEVYAPNEKKSICSIEGEWNGVMYAKHTTGMNEAFVDTKRMAIIKKRVKPVDTQGDFESRRLWRDVTYNLKNKNVEKATEFKHKLEQRQREEAKERKEKGLKWETKFFHEVGEHWVYDRPLLKRLGKTAPFRTPRD